MCGHGGSVRIAIAETTCRRVAIVVRGVQTGDRLRVKREDASAQGSLTAQKRSLQVTVHAVGIGSIGRLVTFKIRIEAEIVLIHSVGSWLAHRASVEVLPLRGLEQRWARRLLRPPERRPEPIGVLEHPGSARATQGRGHCRCCLRPRWEREKND